MMRVDAAHGPSGFVRECIAIAAFVLLLCVSLTATGVLRRADLFFFDIVQPLLQRPSPHKIVLIAIDAASAKALGGWPVKRADYAALIDRLTEAGVAAVGLDVAVTHPGRILPAGDAWLARAAERNGRVVLPVVAVDEDGEASAVPPLAPIAAAAFAVAHVNAVPDADRVSRSFYLREGPPHTDYEHMSVALLRASGVPFMRCGERPEHDALRWSGACRRYVPFASRPSYRTIAFLDALEGRVAPGLLKDAIVLIGPTTSTANTHFITPGSEPQPRAGVEFVAQSTYALASGSLVRRASWGGQLLFTLSVLPWLCAALGMLGPRAALLASIGTAVFAGGMSLLMLKTAHLFFFPAPAVAACLCAYAFSAWRRQEALLQYLTREAERAMADPGLPGDAPTCPSATDPFRRRVLVMSAMIDRLRRSARLISEWMNSLPEATLVASASGAVMLANRRALALYDTGAERRSVPRPAAGRHAAQMLREMTASDDAAQYAHRALQTLAQRSGAATASEPAASMDGLEIVDARQRSLLVKCAIVPAHEAGDAMVIFHVADVTPMRAAERQRDAALRFLSHDMRSPQAAILALIEQRRQAPADLSEAQFADLVGHYARWTLTLADQFLLLARAQARASKATEVDLVPLLGDAVDDLWAHASAKRVRIRLFAEPGMLVVADALLLRRAFANLIDNAVRFSPEGATVTVSADERDGRWCVSVADTGIGIPAHQLPNLFTEFFRVDARGATAGHGLGLAFVKQVVDALGGSIHVESAVGRGSVFTVLLPRNVAQRDS
ncbi:histidine kinase [Burkholderia multivorans]|uniref:CHASE2 domain-containing protein n=1 Tax=Burkholderia multivorans TaxID=87883 RepID=UPI00075CACE0|nr:CHASE2 domain-containing protein [Burkholderia multivorans]KWF65091.1 histidine kinase [Burkholderia multivorans]KWF84616.1 histidine kinase [Burkholderia multivorans]